MMLYIMQEPAKVTELLEKTFKYQSQTQESEEFFVNYGTDYKQRNILSVF